MIYNRYFFIEKLTNYEDLFITFSSIFTNRKNLKKKLKISYAQKVKNTRNILLWVYYRKQ